MKTTIAMAVAAAPDVRTEPDCPSPSVTSAKTLKIKGSRKAA